MTNNYAIIKYLDNYFKNNPEILLCIDQERKIYLQGPRDDCASIIYIMFLVILQILRNKLVL